MQLVSYLNFDGNCRDAFTFYERALGGTIVTMLDHSAMPDQAAVPPEWRTRIMHARLSIGDAVLMGGDAPPDSYKKPAGFSVALQTKDPAEADRVFQALAAGGTVTMPIAETFWSPRFGMLTDRFGVPWMINCEPAA
jgi:PhnB protein